MTIGVQNMCMFRRTQWPFDHDDRLGVAVAIRAFSSLVVTTRP